MALKALSLSKSRIVESKYDPDKGTPDATKFTLGTLDSRVMGKLQDLVTTVAVDPTRPDDEVNTTINQQEFHFQVCQFGVQNIENLQDEGGNEIAFKTVGRRLGGHSYKIVDPEVLKLVPQAVIQEMAEAVMEDNQLTEAEAKN